MTLAINLPEFSGANVSSLKTVPIPGLPSVSLPLLRAYGLRLLSAAYTGPIARLRRSSDDAESDFSFLSDALLWAGSASAYIVKLYDQSGNGNHMLTLAATNQPRVISAGVLDTIGSLGRPKMVFDGTDDYLICTGGQGLYSAGGLSQFGIVSGGAGTTRRLVFEGNSASPNATYAPAIFFSNGFTQQLTNDLGANPIPIGTSAKSPFALVTSGKQITAIDTGSVFKKRVGGVDLADISYTRSSTITLTHLAIGASVKNTVSGYFIGGVSELAFYGGALSDSDRNLIEANQNAYYGTV